MIPRRKQAAAHTHDEDNSVSIACNHQDVLQPVSELCLRVWVGSPYSVWRAAPKREGVVCGCRTLSSKLSHRVPEGTMAGGWCVSLEGNWGRVGALLGNMRRLLRQWGWGGEEPAERVLQEREGLWMDSPRQKSPYIGLASEEERDVSLATEMQLVWLCI